MSQKKKVLVVLPVQENHKRLLEAQAPKAEFIYKKNAEITKEEAQEANIIIGNVPPELLYQSPNLEWIQLNRAGADEYTAEDVLKKGVQLTNATGAFGLAISEHMLGMLLEIQKKLYLYRGNQQQGLWNDEGKVTALEGAIVLVVGLGDIGSEFARKVKALGSYTIGIRRTDIQRPEFMDEVHLLEQLDELIPRADIIALSLPETKETIHLFNRERLNHMKSGAILLNVGRGSAIDTEALCDVLESGHLRGAGLDVTEPEPLPPDHRLWKIKNAIITPHISGQYHLQETFERIVQISAENLKRYFAGKELINVVDFTTGYRKRAINKLRKD